MNEKQFFKNVTDRQLPDLEAVRKACTEQKPAKSKIFSIKPSKLIAVAVIAAISVTGMVAAFASQGGMLFFSTPASGPSASLASTKSDTKSKKPKTKHKTKSNSQINTNSYNSNGYNTQNHKTKSTKKSTKKNYKKYLEQNGIAVDWTAYVGDVDDYAICYAGINSNSFYNCDYIMGGYTFSSPIQRQSYGLGIYAVSKDLCCTLSEAYESKLFSNFSKAAKLISRSDKSVEYGVTVTENDTAHNLLSDYFGTRKATVIAPLGSGSSGYSLFYRISGTYTGESDYQVIIEDMTFNMTETQKRYAPGLYVVSGSEVFTMTEAINNGTITDVRELGTMISGASADIPFNWSFTQAPETETESTTEE